MIEKLFKFFDHRIVIVRESVVYVHPKHGSLILRYYSFYGFFFYRVVYDRFINKSFIFLHANIARSYTRF